MAKGIENRARSPPAVFDFATSQIQKHGGTKMYYDLVESGKRIKALRKEHGLTQEQLAEQLGVAANTIARIETGNRGISGNVKKCAVGKHPKSEKHGNTAQFSEVERSGTQENCGGIGLGCRLRLRPLPVLHRRSPSGLRV